MRHELGSAIRVCAGLLLSATLGTPLAAQVTSRVSVTWNGAQAVPDSDSDRPVITPDGRYVVFDSTVTNLVPGDTNGEGDVFLRDRATGTTELVSIATNGAQGNNTSDAPTISADGRYVVFCSSASNLIPGGTNVGNVYLRDRQSGITQCVTLGLDGLPGNGWSPHVTSDGRYVAFSSSSPNLVPVDTNGTMADVFVWDRLSGSHQLVSLGSSGTQPFSGSYLCDITPDARYVLFLSADASVVPGDTNGNWDHFVRDRQSGTTERVNLTAAGTEVNGPSNGGSISADGRYVVFYSPVPNIVPSDTNALFDIFVRDRQNGTTEIVSVDSTGQPGNQGSGGGGISADGRYVVFSSEASNLAPGDLNGTWDTFLRDRSNGTTECISVDPAGSTGNGASSGWQISAGDRYVVFYSEASNLVPGGPGGRRDVFVRDLAHPEFASLCEPGVAGVLACPCANPPSGQGRGCDNSSSTGGARLAASGGEYLSSDSVVFRTSGEKPTALSIVLQGDASVLAGVVLGQGVRCAGGSLKHLYTKSASAGSITAPDFGVGDRAIHARSATLGDSISAGSTRWYVVTYRDRIVLGGCPARSTFNATQTRAITWLP